MFNFITVGDVHSADKNPSSRIGNYFEDVFDKLHQIELLARKIEADAVFFLGDLFHIKQQRDNSCRLISYWIELLKKYPATVGIAGNHDEIFNNPDTIPNQPLGVLASSGYLTLLNERHQRSKTFEKGGLRVKVSGYPYEKKLGISACDIKKEGEDILIVLAHIYAGITEKSFFEDIIYGYNEISKFDPDIFCLGHYHIDQGTFWFLYGGEQLITEAGRVNYYENLYYVVSFYSSVINSEKD